MNRSASEQDLLQNYLQRYLRPDDEWLELGGSSARYWQARLAQTTTVACLPDGRAKWQVRTRIVENVTKPDEALQLCLALNWYAAGWSFAYDSQSRTIEALAAVCALPEWDTYLLRLSEKAKLGAWMSDVIADRLARAVGGVPAFSRPERQSGVRENFDVNYFYAEALRRRPEWVLDPTADEFLPITDSAHYIAKMIGLSENSLESDNLEFRAPVDTMEAGDPLWLTGGFKPHPIMGESFYSALRVGGAPSREALAEFSAMTWGLFNDPQASLLGGWSYHEDDLMFIQWNTLSEVRRQESLDSWDGRGVGDLWAFTSSLIDPVNALSRVGLTRSDESELSAGLDIIAGNVIAAIAEQARPAVELGLSQLGSGAELSDARLLWLDRSRVVAMAVWFNPLKPAVASLEVCTLPDGTEYLVAFRRQPFDPQYRLVGIVEPDGAIPEGAMSAFLQGNLPNALALWSSPQATADEVPAVLRQRIIGVAAASGEDLVAEAEWVAANMEHPWELVTRGSVVAEAVRAAAKESATADPTAPDPFTKWWGEVSRFENVMANFRCLPDAWDGALNSQLAYGGFDRFGAGPLVITYTAEGFPGGEGERKMTASDVGLEAVERIFNILQIDEEWSVRRPRGFTWWSYRLAQHIDATDVWQDDTYKLSRIRIRTDVVSSVDARRRPEEFVAVANTQETMSAVVWNPDEESISEYCTGIVHEENFGWLTKLLATAAIIQNNAAHGRARGLAEIVGGVPAESNHPVSGEREHPDDMVYAPIQMAEEAKNAGVTFAGSLCSNLSRLLEQYELLGFSDNENFSCEVPFVGTTATAAKVALNLPDKSDHPETSLLSIYPDMDHPNYGSGALVTLLLPIIFDPDQIPGIVNDLNLTEATADTRSSLLGAWCPDPTNEVRNTIAFTAFIPDLLAEPGILENQVVFQGARSRLYGNNGGDLLGPGY